MSYYPPGVTGSEPQITGEWPVDPHAPFSATEDNELEGKWTVYYGDPEKDHGVAIGPFELEAMAVEKADILNQSYRYRKCDPDQFGQCRVCGDIVRDPTCTCGSESSKHERGCPKRGWVDPYQEFFDPREGNDG